MERKLLIRCLIRLKKACLDVENTLNEQEGKQVVLPTDIALNLYNTVRDIEVLSRNRD